MLPLLPLSAVRPASRTGLPGTRSNLVFLVTASLFASRIVLPRALLGVQLDNKLFVDILPDLFATRRRDYSPAHVVHRQNLQPRGPSPSRRGLDCVLDVQV